MDDDIIEPELQFYSFNDFFKKKDIIKRKYNTLTTKEIRIYKMYVYATCFETEHTKDVMWNYLNSIENVNLEIFNEYGLRNNKRRKKNGNNKSDNNNDNNDGID